jgi:hypothetical protein
MAAKNPQVRVDPDLLERAAFVARAFGETTPQYVGRVLRQAIERDLPRARKLIDKKLGTDNGEQAG